MPPLDISFILHSRPLTGSHSNLKEAIDWILRVTGKDGQDSSGGGTQELASAVSILLASVKSSSPELDSNFQKIKGALISSGNNGLIDNLATGLAKFIGYENGGGNIGKGGIAVGKGGTTGEPWKPAENRKGAKGYVYSYDPAEANWKSDGTIEQICAKIFLGCLPMIFSALSYLYWRCHENGGGWKGYRFKGDGPIKTFMVGNGYKVSELNDGMMGSHITYSAMTHSNFKDFKEGMDKAALTAKERAEKEKEAWRKIYPNTSSQSNFNPKPTYPEFLTELQKNGQDKFPQIFSNVQNDSLSILFHISKLYFNAKHFAISKLPDFKPKSPSTIREMLYFLAALPYSPNYGALGTYISDHFKSLVDNSGVKEDYELMIPVADSATNQKHNTLSAANLKDYLTKSSCLSITVLGIIQGHGASENPGEPWLHELFCNNAFRLLYPSGPTLFSSLSNYTYALQFQLYFLYTQCAGIYSRECGWRGCKFGSGFHSPEKPAESHICRKSDNSNTHNNQCGVSTPSPLQAFLTDKLDGFHLSLQPIADSPNHLSDHPPGSMCHVKMGFNPEHLRQNAGTGNYIYSVLIGFCGRPDTPLRQLCEKLGCLTKRTPRTLGDIFGFIWHLNSQLFTTRPTLKNLIDKLDKALGINGSLSNTFTTDPYAVITKIWNKMEEFRSKSTTPSITATVLSRSLESMAPAIPFLYQLFMMGESDSVPGALFDLTQHCHKYSNFVVTHNGSSHPSIPQHQCSEPADLWSLYYAVYSDTKHAHCRNKNCGGYLEPLTLTQGATFSPSSATAYLAWMAYLTDDLYGQLSEMLHDFNNISCEQCSPVCSSRELCHTVSSPNCQCPSVVSCAGVLPLLYRYGFQFYGPYSLNGWTHNGHTWESNSNIKRTCQKLQDQLSAVLAPDAPLAKLLESIDSFLYMFRFYFFYNLSSFWLCSFLILAYFIFYGIDVLHFKSHVHFPASHKVPPVGLLTTGKAPALTKLTYYMP